MQPKIERMSRHDPSISGDEFQIGCFRGGCHLPRFRFAKTKVIIVTSPPHTRRVRTLWKRLAARQNQAIVRAAFEDPFDVDHWWCNTRDTFSVEREMMGLLNAWTGLPVRPNSK